MKLTDNQLLEAHHAARVVYEKSLLAFYMQDDQDVVKYHTDDMLKYFHKLANAFGYTTIVKHEQFSKVAND